MKCQSLVLHAAFIRQLVRRLIKTFGKAAQRIGNFILTSEENDYE